MNEKETKQKEQAIFDLLIYQDNFPEAGYPIINKIVPFISIQLFLFLVYINVNYL